MAAGALQTLRWLVESGVDEAVEEIPRNRFAVPDKAEPTGSAAQRPAEATAKREPRPGAARVNAAGALISTAARIDEARSLARAAADVEALQASVSSFEGCALRQTAKNVVFADGNPQADLMLIGEAPGAEEDRLGLPFVGAAGRLLDRMLAAIDRDRTSTYITNILFWRPPGNRNPTADEIALCLPFVERHIALVRPRVLACVGGVSAKTLLDRSEGITRLRGRWYDISVDDVAEPVATTAIFHPAYLLRQPAQKRLAWRDLQAIRDKLREI